MLRAAAEHPGAALVEIYQNCPIFNDEAYAVLTDKDTKDDHQIRLEHGDPIRFGTEGERGVSMRSDGSLAIVDVARSARRDCYFTTHAKRTRAARSRSHSSPTV